MRKKTTIFIAIAAVFITLFVFRQYRKNRFIPKQPFGISLSDGGNIFAASTSAATVANFLEEKNIVLTGKDYIFPAPDVKIFPGGRIVIQRAIPVMIEVDGETKEVDTLGTNVLDAINESGVALSHADKVSPEKTALLSPNLSIKITRINFEEIAADEDIPFQTIEKEDSTVMWRKRETKQKGETGIREKIYKITYTNGKETNRALLSSRITRQPTSQIDVVGTKIVVGKTQSGAATWYENGNAMTCASLDFAQGKYLRVTNRTNGRSVIVQVNDSGPYGKGRVIDLNKPAFKKIGDLGAGVLNVKVEEILN